MLNLNDNESIIAFRDQITITYVHIDTRVASYVVFLSLRFITERVSMINFILTCVLGVLLK